MNDPALSAAELDAIEMRACMTYPGVRAAADCFFISRSERDGLLAELRALRGEVESLTRQRANRIWPDEGEYQDWLNELMENAGDEFDGDEAMESLAIKYVRALEARVEVLTSALAGLAGLADEWDTYKRPYAPDEERIWQFAADQLRDALAAISLPEPSEGTK
jgi:hypothetical protein